jgi:hypothetical protein
MPAEKTYQESARLGLNHTVNFGQPWQGESACTHGFISLPYLDGPALENFMLDQKVIKFYWLIPVTKEEVDYKAKYGVDALEDRFEAAGFNYINPLRPAVV